MRRSFTTVLVALTLLAPLSASATSLEDLQAQIAALLQQITDLQAQLVQLQATSTIDALASTTAANTMALPGTPFCPRFTRTIMRGASGTDVSDLQVMLSFDSAADYTAAVTGFFGPVTEAALMRWQAAHGLEPVGIAGSRTRAALLVECQPHPPASARIISSTSTVQ